MGQKIKTKNPEQGQIITLSHSVSYNLFMLGLNIYSLIVMVGLITTRIGLFPNEVLWRADFLVCIVFLIDFLVNLWRAPSKGDYFFRKGGWLNLLGSIPTIPGLFWTSFLRLARLNQLRRIVKHLKGQDPNAVFKETLQIPAKTALLTMIIAALVLITIASLLILWVEKDAADAEILTGADAFWWSLATITTVGYGDKVPVTYLGRLVALVIMIFGIGIFAVLTSFVASKVVRIQDDQEDIATVIREENAATREENARIRAELAEIKELLKRQEATNEDAER
jgi:voltage-gated potassium channel